jgi:hypothetical protein
MIGFVKSLLLADLAPEQRTAVWRIIVTFAIAWHITVASGWMPGVPGYVLESDYDKLSATVIQIETNLTSAVNKLEISRLKEDIINAQERFCRAQKDGNTVAQRYALERRDELRDQWKDYFGTDFNLPTCQELGIYNES